MCEVTLYKGTDLNETMVGSVRSDLVMLGEIVKQVMFPVACSAYAHSE